MYKSIPPPCFFTSSSLAQTALCRGAPQVSTEKAAAVADGSGDGRGVGGTPPAADRPGPGPPHSSAFPVERPLGPAAAPSWISCSLPSLPACRATVCVFFYCCSPNFMCESAECRQGLCACCRVSIKQRACAHAACCRHFLPANGQSHGGKGPGFIGPEQCRSELGKKNTERKKKSRPP